MEFDREFWVTVIFTVINILILYLILRKILFKPVTKHMDDRSQKIQDALDMAEDAKKQVAAMKVEYDEKLKQSKEEGAKILEDYKKRADKEYDSIIAKAKQESNIIMENAKADLEVEKEQLVASMKKEMADLVLSASEKVIKENLDNDANRKIISDFIEN
jgi:F-type H+-transporting ATPase subunit b